MEKGMVTIFTVAYNEEIMLPFFIKWYRKRFPNCRIVVYDNESTDDTVKIALENNCEVITYCTNNQLSDSKYLEIKNNCWKDATTDWVLVCDVDEMLDINFKNLENCKYDIIQGKGFEMCGEGEDIREYTMRDIQNYFVLIKIKLKK
jgi:glycosyltransferase involved in cell wall biosynthesis